jgi:hypothetical protein
MENNMDVLEKIEKTEIIGAEFLLWLWFRSETNEGIFDIGQDQNTEIRIDGAITLENNETGAKVTCSGNDALMKEARLALIENKKITLMTVRLILNGEDEFSFKLDSRWMNFRALKTPKVLLDFKDDPEGLFYEKTGLIEKAITVMDSVFMKFIKFRIAPEWKNDEFPALIAWIKNGKNM